MGIPKLFFPHVMFSPKKLQLIMLLSPTINLNVAKSSFLIWA